MKAADKLPTFNRRLLQYRMSARRRGIAFDLTIRDFQDFWQKACSYCGSPIPTIGLDRIDSDRGYERDNVVACCSICNLMKHRLTVESFVEHCARVVRFMASR